MFKNYTFLTLATVAAIALFTLPAFAETEVQADAEAHADCGAHATHIDHEIGAEKALEAYHVLHGDEGANAEAVEMLKAEHPEVAEELAAFVASGCTAADLEAHAGDDAEAAAE